MYKYQSITSLRLVSVQCHGSVLWPPKYNAMYTAVIRVVVSLNYTEQHMITRKGVNIMLIGRVTYRQQKPIQTKRKYQNTQSRECPPVTEHDASTLCMPREVCMHRVRLSALSPSTPRADAYGQPPDFGPIRVACTSHLLLAPLASESSA